MTLNPRRSGVLLTLIAAILFLAGIALFYRSRHAHLPIVLHDGRVAEDLSVAEIGVFAEPEFADSRRVYLENLEQYRKMSTTPVSSDPGVSTAAVAPLIAAEIIKDADTRAALDSLPADARPKLSALAGLLLARCAGLSLADYERLLPYSVKTTPPENRLLLTYTHDQFGGPAAPSIGASEGELRAFFEAFYAVPAEARKGKALVDAVANEGFRFAAKRLSSDFEGGTVLGDKLDPQAKRLLAGGIGQGCPLFHQPPEPWREIRKAHGETIQAQICAVVRNGEGDFYPLWFHFYFHPERGVWVLDSVTRMTSVRMLNLPAFSF